MKNILNRLKNEILVYDGALGTLLQETGALKAGACPEELNLSRPDIIKAIHLEYIKAGADVVETNSFGGNRLKLNAYGLGKEAYKINYEAARAARTASGGKAYVAGSVGPLDRQLKPLGDLSFDEAVMLFKEQIEALKAGGCDIIILETFADIKELKAAFVAAREAGDIPVQAQMTFEEGKRSTYGTPPSSFAVLFQALGAEIIGTNCSTCPKELLNVIKEILPYTDKFISCLPNAGLPELRGGRTFFPQGPKDFASFAVEFAKAGVNLIGGCCGTTPEHINAVQKALKGFSPRQRRYIPAFRLSSRTGIAELNKKTIPLIIGERINPTGKKDLQEEIKNKKTAIIRREAAEQLKKGADILDVNMGAAGCDEPSAISRAVDAVESVCELPISIDSADVLSIEAALKEISGKPLINSVNGDKDKINSILPLVRKYGAALIVLTLDKKGLPDTAKERLKIAARVIKKARMLGIPREDIVVDALTLAISAKPGQVKETLNAITELKKKGYATSLGISNISFGLPNRKKINADFFSLALSYGLDMAITNPGDDAMFRIAKAGKQGNPPKDAIKKFLRNALKPTEAFSGEKIVAYKERKKDIKELLREAILYGDRENIASFVEEALSKGIPPLEINNSILLPALETVGEKFGKREYFLPQVILAAEAMQRAFGRLKKEIKNDTSHIKGRIVIATVEGDIHDIGKNIVASVLETHGYEIYDLGRSVSAEVIIREALKNKADILGLSALMTTTMVGMENVIKKIKRQNLNIKTIVGGAVVTEAFAKDIGASAYAKDAVEAVNVVKSLMRDRQEA